MFNSCTLNLKPEYKATQSIGCARSVKLTDVETT